MIRGLIFDRGTMAVSNFDLRKVPLPARRALGWLLRPIAHAVRKPHDLVLRPQTVLESAGEDIAKAIHQRVAELGEDGFLHEMFGIFAEVTPKQRAELDGKLDVDIARMRRAVTRAPGGKDLLTLIDVAHNRVRNSPMLALPHPVEHGIPTLKALGAIRGIRGRGEVRADRTLDAFGRIADGVYLPYLFALRKLADFGDDRRPPASAPKLGQLAPQLAVRFSAMPLLVERDVAFVRNGIKHEGARYIPSEDAIDLRDDRGRRGRFRITELEVMANRMLVIAGTTFPKALHAFMFEAIFRPMLPAFRECTDAALARNKGRMGVAAAELKNVQDHIFADVVRFMNATTSTA